MSREYSEDALVEETAIDLFSKRLGWDTFFAFNKERYGEGSNLGRLNRKEVVLPAIFFQKLRELNPGLPEAAHRTPTRDSSKAAAPVRWPTSWASSTPSRCCSSS